MNHLALFFLLTTANALQCYQTNVTKCGFKARSWSISIGGFLHGTPPNTFQKCHIAEPHQCEEGDKVCTTLRVTFQDMSNMEIKRCSQTEVCDVRMNEVEEAFGKTASKLECGFCYGDLCNKESTNLTIKDLNTRCYVTSQDCYNRGNVDISGFTKAERRLFKNGTYNCLKREFKTQRCNDGQECLSIPLRLEDGDVLTIKKCSYQFKKNCSLSETVMAILSLTGKWTNDGHCEYCNSNLCNYYTEMVKNPTPVPKPIYCYTTTYEYRKCVSEYKNSPHNMYKCLKNMMTTVIAACTSEPKQCGSLHILIQEDVFSFRECGSVIENYCTTGSLKKEIAGLVNKTVTNTTCQLCKHKSICNNLIFTTEIRKQRGPKCYQSNLKMCIENAPLIIDPEKMLACLRTMNENITTRECKKSEKCVTISSTMENNEQLHYKTCGTGPAHSCESNLATIMENYTGLKLINVKCSYCENDECNDIDTSSARKGSVLLPEKKVQCYNSIPHLCEDKLYKVTEDELENKEAAIYSEIYDCLRNMKNNITWCEQCLTLTFICIFFIDRGVCEIVHKIEQCTLEDDSFQSAFCDDFRDRTKFCHVPMDKEYFWKFTKQVLKHTKCDLCNTDFCNSIRRRGKLRAEAPRSRATHQFSKNISTILYIFTVIYKSF